MYHSASSTPVTVHPSIIHLLTCTCHLSIHSLRIDASNHPLTVYPPSTHVSMIHPHTKYPLSTTYYLQFTFYLYILSVSIYQFSVHIHPPSIYQSTVYLSAHHLINYHYTNASTIHHLPSLHDLASPSTKLPVLTQPFSIRSFMSHTDTRSTIASIFPPLIHLSIQLFILYQTARHLVIHPSIILPFIYPLFLFPYVTRTHKHRVTFLASLYHPSPSFIHPPIFSPFCHPFTRTLNIY